MPVQLRLAKIEETLGERAAVQKMCLTFCIEKSLISGNEGTKTVCDVICDAEKGASCVPNDEGERISYLGEKVMIEVKKR